MSHIAVVDLGGTNIKYGLADTDTDKILFCDETPTCAWEGAQAVLDRVIKLLRPYEFIGLGLCSGGQIDIDGTVAYATENLPGYTGMAVADRLREVFPVPVAVENDVNAAALGEASFGAARGFSHFICVTFGTGIGGAIVIDGKVFRGRHGGAGEFGHFVTHRDGLRCTCGMRGCYEAYAATTALTKRASEKFGREMNGRELLDLLHGSDSIAQEIVGSWLEEVAVGLAGLVHIFDPEAVVLGGGIMDEALITMALPSLVRRYTMPSYHATKLIPAELGNTAGMLGMYSRVKQVL